jgi:hypothetical protein
MALSAAKPPAEQIEPGTMGSEIESTCPTPRTLTKDTYELHYKPYAV